MIRRKRQKTVREPTIALINVVFLMLVFFMVAGTVAQPLDGDLQLVQTADLEGRAPPDALIVHPDGTLSYQGQPIADAAAFYASQPDEERDIIRIVPDRDLPAAQLVAVAGELRGLGAKSVLLVTERGVK
ncbi:MULTISPECIES: biopolymer transporter ExbD [unclassified Roseovarius]|uniref:ExbD/TolR family protein n=1 Tax=unclassified Roseovarius TaxID=2614913 RepID=UPI00273ED0CE|nr:MULTISPECIES: biopolymer transporter ExbD [unclassified Roseovarius]